MPRAATMRPRASSSRARGRGGQSQPCPPQTQVQDDAGALAGADERVQLHHAFLEGVGQGGGRSRVLRRNIQFPVVEHSQLALQGHPYPVRRTSVQVGPRPRCYGKAQRRLEDAVDLYRVFAGNDAAQLKDAAAVDELELAGGLTGDGGPGTGEVGKQEGRAAHVRAQHVGGGGCGIPQQYTAALQHPFRPLRPGFRSRGCGCALTGFQSQ